MDPKGIHTNRGKVSPTNPDAKFGLPSVEKTAPRLGRERPALCGGKNLVVGGVVGGLPVLRLLHRGATALRHPLLVRLVPEGIHFLEGSLGNILVEVLLDPAEAAGEAFDKCARIMGMPYPGGPEIEKRAIIGDSKKYKFPIPVVKSNPLNFSFSGLKTSLLYRIKSMSNEELNNNINNICASYQEAILDTLFNKLKLSLSHCSVENISICFIKISFL